MAGIFDLFRVIDDRVQPIPNTSVAGGTMKKFAIRSGAPGANPAKHFGSGSGRPKGLSMRSHSDLNITTAASKSFTNIKSEKPMDLLQPVISTQVDIDGNPISPRAKEQSSMTTDLEPLLNRSCTPELKLYAGSPKLIIPEDNCFKKPSTPTSITTNAHSMYQEPEKLCFYYDEEQNFFNSEDQPLEAEFKELVATLTRSIQSYDDEGFESDPELLLHTALPKLDQYIATQHATRNQEDSFDLPEISDDEF